MFRNLCVNVLGAANGATSPAANSPVKPPVKPYAAMVFTISESDFGFVNCLDSRCAMIPANQFKRRRMALRFRKSIKLAPGVRWNISGSGSSWTLGPKGASIGIGKRGTYLNSGIPGTGLFSRSRLSGDVPRQVTSSSFRPSAPSTTTVQMTCGIANDGTLTFTDAAGASMPEHVVELAKKQNREVIQNLIQTKCDEINARIEVLGLLHCDTPDCKVTPKFRAPEFPSKPPNPPIPKVPGFFDKLFNARAARIADANKLADEAYEVSRASWLKEKAAFDAQVAERRDLVEKRIYADVPAMEQFLEESLQDITWPRETKVDFDINDEGATVNLDVDLPELEDMPTKLAAVPSRGLKLSVKEMTGSKVQKLYSDHVHSIAFRLIGEVFAALPRVQVATFSGYSQRRSKVTGQLSNEYLISVRVQRSDWQQVDFRGLGAIEAASALIRFDLILDQLKTGHFKEITPHQT